MTTIENVASYVITEKQKEIFKNTPLGDGGITRTSVSYPNLFLS